jgi:hypothetical protein
MASLRKKFFIYGKPCGQFGNRLFTAAAIMSYAREYNFSFVFLGFHKYANLIKGTQKQRFAYGCLSGCVNWLQTLAEDLIRIYVRNISVTPVLRKHVQMLRTYISDGVVDGRRVAIRNVYNMDNPIFLQLVNDRQIVYFDGLYFFSPATMNRHSDAVRQYFAPQDMFLENARRRLNSKRDQHDYIIGVHIRRGDYARWHEGRYFYSPEQYLLMMQKVSNIFPSKKVLFCICSDESVSMEYFDRFDCIKGTGHIMEDCCALSLCDYIIGPPSTYSGWASFYGQTPYCVVTDPEKSIVLSNFIKISSLDFLGTFVSQFGDSFDLTNRNKTVSAFLDSNVRK